MIYNINLFFKISTIYLITGKERYEFTKELLSEGTTNIRNKNILSNKNIDKNDKSNI